MSDVEWAFPGPEPYTYMHASPEFFGITTKDPHELGKEYVKHLMLWKMGVEAGKKIDVSPSVTYRDAESSPTLADLGRAMGELHERNIAARPMEPQAAEDEVKSQLGATVVESDAPWNNKDMAPTAPKPWEKKTSTIDIDI